MNHFLTFTFLMYSIISIAQNPIGFDSICNNYIRNTIPIATSTQLKFELDRDSSIVILDAREKNEYNISHIPNAIYIGYNDFDLSKLPPIKNNQKIYVYCSIGYRSEKIGEKLKAAGYNWVLNLYGGIFDWANNNYPLIDNENNKTIKVHGFDKNWGKWINDNNCKKIID